MREQQQQRQQQQHQEISRRHSAGPPVCGHAPDEGPPGGHCGGGPLEGPTSQRLPSAEVLALFAPSTRTPPPRKHTSNPKSEERANPWGPLERTPATSARARQTRDPNNKPEEAAQQPQQPQQQGGTASHPSGAARRHHREAVPQAHTNQHQQHQTQLRQEALLQPETRRGQSVPEVIVTPPQDFPTTPVSFAQQQPPQQRHNNGTRPEPQQPSNGTTGTAAPEGPPTSSKVFCTRGSLPEHHQDPPNTRSHADSQRGPRCPSARARRGRKRRDFCTRRKNPVCCQRLSEGPLMAPGSSSTVPSSRSVGEDGLRPLLSCEISPGATKPLHADCLLELSPLLLAKILQLLPTAAVAAFGSTCWWARRVLLSYCCIVSLSAKNVSSLLSLPPAAIKRQLPILSGLKTLEIELTPAVSPPLFLGANAAATAVAAAPGGSLMPPEGVYERGTAGRSNRGGQAHTPRGTRGERRQQQQRSSSSRQQQQQQEGDRREVVGLSETPLEGPSTRLSWAYGLMQGRALDLLRIQPLLSDSAAAAEDIPATPTAEHVAARAWTTFAAASASLLLESLRSLTSVSARLKMSLTGGPGDAQAATELLLLLQVLVHTNAHSLVSLKIAVDLPPSSVVWRHIPPLLLPPSLPLLKSLHIDFPFQVTSSLSISLGFSSLSIHSAHRLMLMKTSTLWREPMDAKGPTCVCFSARGLCAERPCEGSCGDNCAVPAEEEFCTGERVTYGAPTSSHAAAYAVSDNAFDSVKNKLGNAAPAAFASAAPAASAGAARAASRVVAYLMLGDSCIVGMHQDGSICFIRRKKKPSPRPQRPFCGTNGIPLPLSGQAVAFFRRGALLLSELSAVTGGPFFYRLQPGTTRRTPGEGPSDGSLAEPNLAAPEQQQPQQRTAVGSLMTFSASSFFRYTNSTPQQHQNQHQHERQTQELLVGALQHLIGIAAESLQLLDVDGEVRHFSVLYEKLHFKCLRRLSLGWTITPELQQLLFLFSSRKLRSLQKLNFNGPAQIHPEAYIHICHSNSTPSNNSNSGIWSEPFATPLDEATLRRSAGLNNYGLGQIHLQLYALLNCGACSVSQIDYARQQLLQQQLLLLRSHKQIKRIVAEIKSHSDPLGLEEVDVTEPANAGSEKQRQEEFEQLDRQQEQRKPLQLPCSSFPLIPPSSSIEKPGTKAPGTAGLISSKVLTKTSREDTLQQQQQQPQDCCEGATADFNGMLLLTEGKDDDRRERAGGGSCCHRVQQAGSWLWRALPSTFWGLAGTRGAPRAPYPPSRESSQGSTQETQDGVPLETRGLLSDKQGAKVASLVDVAPAEGLHGERAAVMRQQGEISSPRRRRPSPSRGDSRGPLDAGEASALPPPKGGPRPKRRRLVEGRPATPSGSAQTTPKRLRKHLAAFAREHLPLLGDLVCPHLEALAPNIKAPLWPFNGGLSSQWCLEGPRRNEGQQRHPEMKLLKDVSAFLLEAAGDTIGLMLAENNNSSTSSNGGLPHVMPPPHQLIPPPSTLGRPCRVSPSRAVPPTANPLNQQQQQHSQLQMQQQDDEDEGLSLLRLLQYPPPSRSSWSHGVFFKYAYVDLDFECLATFRICLCHHPLFIFYKEHEKGLHVLHVDGVFNPATDGAQEKKELWRERLSYTYVCDPAVPFQQQHHQEIRRQQRHLQQLDATVAPNRRRSSLSRGPRSFGDESQGRRDYADGSSPSTEPNRGPVRVLLPNEALVGSRALPLTTPSTNREGDIRLCSARASISPAFVHGSPGKEEIVAPLLPHVGPHMTGYDLFCLEMWSVLSLCRDQVSPPTLPQYSRALRRLWSETLTQQQRDIYNNIITPKYIARRLRAPDLTFEALPPWWQQQQQSHSPERGNSTSPQTNR